LKWKIPTMTMVWVD